MEDIDELSDDALFENVEGGESEEINYQDFFEKSSKKAHKNTISKETDHEAAENDTSENETDENDTDENDENEEFENENNAENDESESDSNESKNSKSQSEPKKENQSRLELQQAQKKKEIQLMEEKIAAPRSWELMGEVYAKDRPENSALEKFLDYDVKEVPAPVVDKEYIEDIEEMIKKRILINEFDENTPQLQAKAMRDAEKAIREAASDLSTEKSELGLAEVYAEQYKMQRDEKTANSGKTDLSAAHQEALSMFAKLSHSLDALSNFHFTPRPAKSEWEVKKPKVSAVNLEEKGLTSEAAGSLLTTVNEFDVRSDDEKKRPAGSGEIRVKSREENKRNRKKWKKNMKKKMKMEEEEEV